MRPRPALSTLSRIDQSERNIVPPVGTNLGSSPDLSGISSWSPSTRLDVSVSIDPFLSTTEPFLISPMRNFGPGRSWSTATWFPVLLLILLMEWMTFRCSEGSPWEKFSLAQSIPALTKRCSIDSELVAGPIVQTIFVRLRLNGSLACMKILDTNHVDSNLAGLLFRRAQQLLSL